MRGRWRLALCVGVIFAAWAGHGWWSRLVAGSLVCSEELAPVDAIIIDNFDPNYLLFERAEALQRAGYARRVFVPVDADADLAPSRVSSGIAEVMARVARLDPPELIPVTEQEPITFNAVKQIRRRLTAEHVQSVIVVASGLRSRRTELIYKSLLPTTHVSCVPVFGRITPGTWSQTWHGIQEVTEQLVKLQYYRLYVLPVYVNHAGGWRSTASSVPRGRGVDE